MKKAAILRIVTTLLPAGAAQAHRKNYIPRGYVSNISAVVPNVLGVSVNVLAVPAVIVRTKAAAPTNAGASQRAQRFMW